MNRTVLVLCSALLLSPWLTASPLPPAEERADPVLWTVVSGGGWLDGETGEGLYHLVTVWSTCSPTGCQYEAYVHWVKPQVGHSFEFVETKVIRELNDNHAMVVRRLFYYEMDASYIFELEDARTKKHARLFLWARDRGKYETLSRAE